MLEMLSGSSDRQLYVSDLKSQSRLMLKASANNVRVISYCANVSADSNVCSGGQLLLSGAMLDGYWRQCQQCWQLWDGDEISLFTIIIISSSPSSSSHHIDVTFISHRCHHYFIASTTADLNSCVALSSSATRCLSPAFTCSRRPTSSSWSINRCLRVSRDRFDATLFLRRLSRYWARLLTALVMPRDFCSLVSWYVWSAGRNEAGATSVADGRLACSLSDVSEVNKHVSDDVSDRGEMMPSATSLIDKVSCDTWQTEMSPDEDSWLMSWTIHQTYQLTVNHASCHDQSTITMNLHQHK